MRHVVIRREDYVAGSTERLEIGVFTQTHASKLPTPWGRKGIGRWTRVELGLKHGLVVLVLMRLSVAWSSKNK